MKQAIILKIAYESNYSFYAIVLLENANYFHFTSKYCIC